MRKTGRIACFVVALVFLLSAGRVFAEDWGHGVGQIETESPRKRDCSRSGQRADRSCSGR